MQLHWHRRNLRPRPNPALSTAAAAAERAGSRVVPLFVLDDAILSRADSLRVAFMLGSLGALRDWYRDHGGDIAIQHGDPTEVVRRVARTVGAERVVWNRDHSRLARGRDRAVRRALGRAGVDYASVPAGTDASGAPLADPEASLADPAELGVETEAVPRLSELCEDTHEVPLTAGTASARKRLRAMSNGTTYRRCDDSSDRVDGDRRGGRPRGLAGEAAPE